MRNFDKWNEKKKKIDYSAKSILSKKREIVRNQKKYFLTLSQIRLFSAKRLSRIIYKIDSQDFLRIKKELKIVIGLNEV